MNSLRQFVMEALAAEGQGEDHGAGFADPVAANAARVLCEARRIATAIPPALPDGELRDLNKYDFVLGRLGELVGMEGFSLAEYTYALEGERHPGVRLWLNSFRWRRRVSVVLFPDVVIWQLDANGAKVKAAPLHLYLDGEAPQPEIGSPDLPDCPTWQACLAEAFLLPLSKWGL